MIDTNSIDKMEIVLQEIRSGKIRLDMSNEIITSDDAPDFANPPELDLDSLGKD